MNQYGRRKHNVSRIAVPTHRDSARRVDSKDGRVITIVHIRKSLGHCVLHVEVIHVAVRRVCTGEE